MTRRFPILFASAFWLMAGCAAPSEPSGLQSSGVDKAAASTTSTTTETVDYGGALVGDSATQATVTACLQTGKFYERRSNPDPICTTLDLAKVSCKDLTVKSIMSADQKTQFDGLLAGSLAGYLVDQCMDCSTPTGNTYCEGTGTTKQTAPGIRIFLVKDSSGTIDIKTVYIAK